jgi:hypothetical protein
MQHDNTSAMNEQHHHAGGERSGTRYTIREGFDSDVADDISLRLHCIDRCTTVYTNMLLRAMYDEGYAQAGRNSVRQRT